MNEQVQAMLARIPLIPLLLAYGAYVGWGYYSFTTDSSSPLIQRQQVLQQVQKQEDSDRLRLKKAEDFYRSLEQRRAGLRALALQLEQAKATISEDFDTASFIRSVVAEANRVGITVMGIKPAEKKERDYYVQQAIDVRFRGVFVQTRVFLERLAELERIVRISKLSVRPTNPADSEYVLLEGDLELDIFRYRDSKADELGKQGAGAGDSKGGSK